MKKFATAIIAGSTLLVSSAAMAEAHNDGAESPPVHYAFEGTLDVTMMVGGVGGQVFAASWTETLTIGEGDSAVTVTSQCGGMDQPENSLFDRHFTCSQQTADGASKGAVLFGCNKEGDEGREMHCYGYFEGQEGPAKDRVGLETAYYWFMPDGSGKVVGSGQWIR